VNVGRGGNSRAHASVVYERGPIRDRNAEDDTGMKVFELRDEWSLDHLRLGERPIPVPGPHQVLLRMRAASLIRNARKVTARLRRSGIDSTVTRRV